MDEEITVTMSRKLWVDLLIDLDWMAQELDERRPEEGGMTELEPGSYQLIRELGYVGVEL